MYTSGTKFEVSQKKKTNYTEESREREREIEEIQKMAEEGKSDAQLFQLLSNLLQQVGFFSFSQWFFSLFLLLINLIICFTFLKSCVDNCLIWGVEEWEFDIWLSIWGPMKLGFFLWSSEISDLGFLKLCLFFLIWWYLLEFVDIHKVYSNSWLRKRRRKSLNIVNLITFLTYWIQELFENYPKFSF